MIDDYPTAEALASIATWPADDARGWFDAIKAAWWAADWGWSEEATPTKTTIHVSTGGWSGNEEIMATMRGHLLFGQTWQSSRRGGHSTFILERQAPDSRRLR